MLKSRLKCRFLTLRYAFYYKEYLWFSKVNVNIPTKFLWNTSIPFLEYVLKNYQLLELGCLNFVLIYLCKNNGFCKLTDIYLELNPLSISTKFTCCVLTKIVSLHLAIIVFPFSCKLFWSVQWILFYRITVHISGIASLQNNLKSSP